MSGNQQVAINYSLHFILPQRPQYSKHPMLTIVQDLFYRSLGRLGLMATLRGHHGPVISLAISLNGDLMASGGKWLQKCRCSRSSHKGADGVKIWDLKTKKVIDIPQQAYNERGQVSCICWITHNNENFETLCYGNTFGFLVFLQHCLMEVSFQWICLYRCKLKTLHRADLKFWNLVELHKAARFYTLWPTYLEAPQHG